MGISTQNAIAPASGHCGNGLVIDSGLLEKPGAAAEQHLRAAVHQLFDDGSGAAVVAGVIKTGGLWYAVIGAAQHFLGAFAASC